MIDVESTVFRTVKTAVGDSAVCLDSYQPRPRSFPLVTVEETDNSFDAASEDSGDSEKFSIIVYEINVYTSKPDGKKKQARSLIKTVDDAMFSLGFARTSCRATPNLADATVYRMTARYKAVIDNLTETVYRK